MTRLEAQAAPPDALRDSQPDLLMVRTNLIDAIGIDLSKAFAQGNRFEPFDQIYVLKVITRVLDDARGRAALAAPAGYRGRGANRNNPSLPVAAALDPAEAAPAGLPAIDTRIVWKRDHGMVLVTGDEEPQSLEIPAWAVRTIFDVAGKDPEEEARKVSAFINAHTGLDVERLARAIYAITGMGGHADKYGIQYDLTGAKAIAAAYADDTAEKPDPLVTYTDPAGGPDWEPREDEA